MSIDLHTEDHVCVITINRPERMNALDSTHYDDLSAAWRHVRDDAEIRVAIVTGAGNKSFCAGADLKSFVSAEPELQETMLTQKSQLLNRGLEVWKPVIAAVNGYCLGGGMTLLLASDIRIASRYAQFGLSEVKRGIFPANGGTQRIAQQLPHAIAMEMLLIGDQFDAQVAQRWGIVNEITEPQDLMETAYRYARKLAENAPLAVQAAKELAIRGRDTDLATGLRMEQVMLRLLQTSSDVKEGAKAFSEKRKAVFLGK